jgi:hypothetical protein
LARPHRVGSYPVTTGGPLPGQPRARARKGWGKGLTGDVQLDLSLPGIVSNTSPTDYRVNKQLQMMRFKGERWEGFGPIITDDYGGWDASRAVMAVARSRECPIGTKLPNVDIRWTVTNRG